MMSRVLKPCSTLLTRDNKNNKGRILLLNYFSFSAVPAPLQCYFPHALTKQNNYAYPGVFRLLIFLQSCQTVRMCALE